MTLKTGSQIAAIVPQETENCCNRRIANTIIGQDVQQALADYPFPVMKTAIAQRVSFAEASAGYTVLETVPSGDAAREIKAFAKEVLKLMGMKKW